MRHTSQPMRFLGEWKFPRPVLTVVFSPDGRQILTVNANGTVYVLKCLLNGTKPRVLSVPVMVRGQRLFIFDHLHFERNPSPPRRHCALPCKRLRFDCRPFFAQPQHLLGKKRINRPPDGSTRLETLRRAPPMSCESAVANRRTLAFTHPGKRVRLKGELQRSAERGPVRKSVAENSRRLPAATTALVKPGILITDDEPLVRRLLQLVLEQQGFTVWLAANGREAVELYRQHRQKIAVVLLDVRMPELDGPQALAALREFAPNLVCCFMTGHAGAYTESELLGLGAIRVFAKPFALEELCRFLWQLAARLERRGA